MVTSELARVEFTSAVTAAVRAGRLEDGRAILDRFDADCTEGPVSLLALRPDIVLPAARRLVRRLALRTLDAIHLAVAVEDAAPLADGQLVLVTRDHRQAAAAQELQLEMI